MPVDTVVHMASSWSGQLLGSGGQRSRSHEAEDRSEDLAEASFLTPLGRVGFLVKVIYLLTCRCYSLASGVVSVNPLILRATDHYTVILWLVHWPLMGELLHFVQRGGAWAGWGPAQFPPRCTKCSSPRINGQCTNFILFDVEL